MARIRKRIEKRFESLGHLVFRHRWVALAAMLVLVGGLSSNLPKIKIDTATESFLHKDDPTIITYNEFRDQFGRDEMILVAIESSDIFTQKFLRKLKAFHEDLENNVPHVDDITSLVNARNTRGEGDRLIVEDLLEKWPKDETDLQILKERVLSNYFYKNRLISVDGRFTAVAIKTDTYSSLGSEEDALDGFDDDEEDSLPSYLTDQENNETVTAVRKLVNKYNSPDFETYLAGSPVTIDVLKRHMLKDMYTFMRLVLLTIGVFLFIMFRRITGVILPFIIVAFAVLSTLGLMALCGVAMTLPTNILPSFMLAIGVGAAVHVLAIFYMEFQKGKSREEAICHALGHSGLAILMTSLTTAAGLASFASAEVAPIAHLGIFASIGVLIALLNTIILLPAFLAIIPVKLRDNKNQQDRSNLIDKFLENIAIFSTHNAKTITTVAIIVIIISLTGVAKNSLSHNIMIWLPEKLPVRTATEKIDHELRGTVTLEILVDTGKENGLYEVSILNKLATLAADLEKFQMGERFVGKATSVADMLKEIHQALNENRPEYYAIPQDPKIIPQEFLLFENSGSDDLEDVVDSQFSKARFTIKAPWGDAVEYMPFLKEIEKRFKLTFRDDAEITATGLMPMFIRTAYAVIHSMVKSYITAFVVITFMMMLLIGSVRLGLVSMIPNLLPIILTLGIIGWFDFPFDMFTMLIGSIAIGLAVDDTVHFMHNFIRYYYDSERVTDSVTQTLQTSGRAMLVTSIVLSIGFFIFMFASMKNLFYFGLFTGITIITALLADFIVAPALMALIKGKRAKA